MPPPHRTAGSRLPHWGSAALLSVGVHGLLAWAWCTWAQADGPLGRARHLGTPPPLPLRVHLVASKVSTQATTPPRDTPATPALDRAHTLAHTAATAPGRRSPLGTLATSAAPEPVPVPNHPDPANSPSPSPASPPGGRFAGLFAPITTQALGRGGWARATPRSPEDEAAQRWRDQQAMVAASQAMRQRTQAWLLALQSPAAQALKAACEVRMSLTAHSMHVRCQDATDQARLAQALGGNAPDVQPPDAPKPSDLQCLHAEGTVAEWVACTDANADGGAGTGVTPPLAAR